MSHSISRREFGRITALGAGSVFTISHNGFASSKSANTFSIHHDHQLGTSLDVIGAGASAFNVDEIETLVLNEVERYRTIFSLYDSSSELSRFNQHSGRQIVSPELFELLEIAANFRMQSRGAFNPFVGNLVNLWAKAEQLNQLPTTGEIHSHRIAIQQAGYRLDPHERSVSRLGFESCNLNSIVKGYLLHQIQLLLRNAIPTLQEVLINLGGDLIHWSEQSSALIAIQNPATPAENTIPLTLLKLRNCSVATSGNYQRFYTIQGRQFSHLIDPRTGYPADQIRGATVIAPAGYLANLIATTLCVLSPEEGIELVSQVPNVECVIVDTSGNLIRSPGFADYELARFETSTNTAEEKEKENQPKGKSSKESKSFPENYQLTVSLELPKPPGKARRPYVAVWIEDGQGKAIRTIAVWGNNSKWLRELSGWWKLAKDDKKLVAAVTRATRAPGKYQVVWDGKNDQGELVPEGEYTVRIEVHREHGKHLFQTGKITVGSKPQSLTLEKNAEIGDTVLDYAEKKK